MPLLFRQFYRMTIDERKMFCLKKSYIMKRLIPSQFDCVSIHLTQVVTPMKSFILINTAKNHQYYEKKKTTMVKTRFEHKFAPCMIWVMQKRSNNINIRCWNSSFYAVNWKRHTHHNHHNIKNPNKNNKPTKKTHIL